MQICNISTQNANYKQDIIFNILRVFPIPVQDELYVEYQLDNTNEGYFQIHYLLGKELFRTLPLNQESEAYRQSFAVNNFITSSGIYMLTIHFGESQVSKKIHFLKN